MMWIIYLFGLLGNLNTFFTIMSVILFCAVPIAFIFRSTELSFNGSEETLDVFDKWLKRGIISFFICLMGLIFVPTEKQLYAIVGIGGTLDYLNGNDKAKQIPDKVIEAVYKYLDNNNSNAEK